VHALPSSQSEFVLQPPPGSVVAVHRGVQNSFGSGHVPVVEHGSPVQRSPIVSKQPAAAVQAPACARQTAARWRSQSLPYVVPSQPQTGSKTAGHASGRVMHTPPVLEQLPAWHSQNWAVPQSASALQVRHGMAPGPSGHAAAASRRTRTAQRRGSVLPRTARFTTDAAHLAYVARGAQQLH
jgi:hypothetical protein